VMPGDDQRRVGAAERDDGYRKFALATMSPANTRGARQNRGGAIYFSWMFCDSKPQILEDVDTPAEPGMV